MAQGFFKHIPNIQYDFKSDGKFHKAKDLFRKVSTWSYLQEGISGYNYYRITEGERPDVVASRLYGDGTLYWLFFLVNENLQDFNDWPKSNQLFLKFMDRKYPGTCLEASSSTDIVSYDHSLEPDKQNPNRKFILGEKVKQSSSVYGFVTDVNPTHNRITLKSVSGTFTANSTAITTRINDKGQELAELQKSFTISSVVNEQDAINHYINSNSFKTTVSTGNTAVSNLDHERNLNEDKHLIRYIEPRYVHQVTKEFIELVRD